MDRCTICGRLVGMSEAEEGAIIDRKDIKLLIKNGIKIIEAHAAMGKSELRKISWMFDVKNDDILCNEHFEQWYSVLGCNDENEYLDLLSKS